MPVEHTYKHPVWNSRSQTLDEFPDVCPWCERSTTAKPVFTEEHLQDMDFGDGMFLEIVFQCVHESCDRLFIAQYYGEQANNFPLRLDQLVPPRIFKDVHELVNNTQIPERVREDLLETNHCHQSKLFQAFGCMVRRVVHSICADKQAVGSDLKRQIDDLFNRGIFTEEIANRAHDLRTLGRHGAHPEWEIVTPEMADIGVAHMIWILQTIYLAPPDRNWRKSGKRR